MKKAENQKMESATTKNTTSTADQWLIKSANRVMGPFKLNEVIVGLQLKHFTIMDEISQPFGRWILIRDELALQSAVKEIRNRAESPETTATLTHTLSSSLNVTLSIKEAIEKNSTKAPGKQKTSRTGKSNKSKKSSLPLFFIFLVLLGAGLFYFFNLNKIKQKDTLQESLALVNQLKSQGFYDRAFSLLNKIKTTDRVNPLVDLDIAIFQILLQNQNTVGRKNIEKLLPYLEAKEAKVNALTAMALSFLNDNEYKNASEMINKALSVDPNYLPALINRAIIDFGNGNPELAEQDFEPILSQTNNGVIVLGLTLASLEVNRKGLMPKRILPVLIQILDDYLKNNFDLQQEVYLLKAYIYTVLGKSQSKIEEILSLLNSDLESGQGHRNDLLVDRTFLSWKNLLPYCQTIVESDSNQLLFRTLLAYCYSKAGQDLESKKIILEAEAESPRNPNVASIKAYIMNLLGQDSESQASLGVALSDRKILSSWLLKSKFCEKENNDTCVQETLNQLMNINPRSLPLYVGMAKVELKKGNKKNALDWIQRGQNLSQTYMPLWELKNSL